MAGYDLETVSAPKKEPIGYTGPDVQQSETPEEDRLKSVKTELDRRMGIRGNFGTNNYGELVRQYGDKGLIDEADYVWGKIHSETGDKSEQYDRWRDFTQTREAELRDRIEREISGLNTQEQDLRTKAIDRRLSKFQAQQQQAMDALSNVGIQLSSAINTNLNNQLEQTSLQAGQLRSQTGAAAAERGLGRSTMAANAVNDVTAGELEQKAGLRTQAQGMQQKVQNVTQGAKEDIETKAQSVQNRRDLAELQAATDAGFEMDAQKVKMKYQSEIDQLQLDAADKSFFGDLLGGIFQGAATLGGFALGGPAGAIAANTGSKAITGALK